MVVTWHSRHRRQWATCLIKWISWLREKKKTSFNIHAILKLHQHPHHYITCHHMMPLKPKKAKLVHERTLLLFHLNPFSWAACLTCIRKRERERERERKKERKRKKQVNELIHVFQTYRRAKKATSLLCIFLNCIFPLLHHRNHECRRPKYTQEPMSPRERESKMLNEWRKKERMKKKRNYRYKNRNSKKINKFACNLK